ncbi:Ldh family oxidoreductase [Nocardia tengchongensis]
MATGVLAAAGASPDAAAITAADVLYAEASGVASHGLLRLPYLADQVKSGKIRAGRPTVVQESAAVLRIDGACGFGYVAARLGVDAVIDGLARGPVVVAAVSNSHHLGMAGRHAERIAEAGFLGLVCSSTSGAIAPLGGHRALLGNSPLALAVPVASGGADGGRSGTRRGRTRTHCGRGSTW